MNDLLLFHQFLVWNPCLSKIAYNRAQMVAGNGQQYGHLNVLHSADEILRMLGYCTLVHDVLVHQQIHPAQILTAAKGTLDDVSKRDPPGWYLLSPCTIAWTICSVVAELRTDFFLFVPQSMLHPLFPSVQ